MENSQRYEDLDITNNFMFCKVFSHVDVAKDFLQDVLKIKIEKISVVHEASLEEDPFHKGVRFDVLVREEVPEPPANAENTQPEAPKSKKAKSKKSEPGKPEAKKVPGVGRSFDIEMQMRDTHEFAKRARYYQSVCDMDSLAKGVDYDELREQYILFLCPEDIFGAGKPIYRFQNRDESDPGILMGDLCYKNFYIFNKYGEVEDESTREYMRYFSTKECVSAKMRRIHDLVEKYRKDPTTRKAYMTLEQELNIRYKKGRAEGRAEGVDSRNRELAKAFRDDGVSLEIISKRTGLTPEEIKAL